MLISTYTYLFHINSHSNEIKLFMFSSQAVCSFNVMKFFSPIQKVVVLKIIDLGKGDIYAQSLLSFAQGYLCKSIWMTWLKQITLFL